MLKPIDSKQHNPYKYEHIWNDDDCKPKNIIKIFLLYTCLNKAYKINLTSFPGSSFKVFTFLQASWKLETILRVSKTNSFAGWTVDNLESMKLKMN